MIPKKIHYCWFGRGEKPQMAKKCIASWKKYCPDYEIIEWNEDSFDINRNGYTRWCYENRKYAFLSDYARLVVVEEYGGLYFDTDVELLKPPEQLLDHEAYFGFENEKFINTGIGFGAEAGNVLVQRMLEEYNPLLSGENGVVGCPELNTKALVKMGLRRDGTRQEVHGAVIYPAEYFNPYESNTGRLNKTDNTISIHWYSASWMSTGQRMRSVITKPLHRIFGVDFFKREHGE